MLKILNSWWIFMILYLVFVAIFNQFVKISTKTSKHDGALTAILQLVAGISVLVFIPFFEIKFPTDYKIWLFLGLSIIFYAINDRIHTTARKNLEVSMDSILRQLSTVFVFIVGITFFKEESSLFKILGITLILFSNILILYSKGNFKLNKYVWINLISILSYSIATCLDVGNSGNFTLPIYISTTLVVPAILIIIFEKIKLKELKDEFLTGNKKAILIGGLSWGLLILALLRAYGLADVTIISPLSALSVIINVIVSYIFLKERNSIVKKIISAVGIAIGVLLITIF